MFQHDWSLTIRLFSVKFRTLVGETYSLQRRSQYILQPPVPVDWINSNTLTTMQQSTELPTTPLGLPGNIILDIFVETLSYLPNPSARAGYETRSIF